MALRPNEQRDDSTDLNASVARILRCDWFSCQPRWSRRRASLKSGKVSSITSSRRKSHECALAARGLRLKN